MRKFQILPRSDAAQFGLSITVGVCKKMVYFLLKYIYLV